MNLAVFGLGLVGQVTSIHLAEMGHNVIGVDNCSEKIKMLNDGISDIYEPGLNEYIKSNLLRGRLRFVDRPTGIYDSLEAIFVAVGTPESSSGEADLNEVYNVVNQVIDHVSRSLSLVIKSTVPVGTCEKLQIHVNEKLAANPNKISVNIVSNPEFLRSGCAVKDAIEPDRIVVGGNSDRGAFQVLNEIYRPLVLQGVPLLEMETKSSELVKYVANAFLATKVSFANEVSQVCEVVDANVSDVLLAMTLDSRIAESHLSPSLGFGGSCFPKDINALIHLSEKIDTPLNIVKATKRCNEFQTEKFIEKVSNKFPHGLKGKKITVWGLTFKANTSDFRCSPTLQLIENLKEQGAQVVLHDPSLSIKSFPKTSMPTHLFELCQDIDNSLNGAEALCICTEWDIYKKYDLEKLIQRMACPNIVDGRNIWNKEKPSFSRLSYSGVGMKEKQGEIL